MANLNRVLLMGRLTRDPEVKYIPSGMAVAELGMAINRKYKKGDDWQEETTFVDVTVWGKTAENVGQYLSKGSPLFVEGRLSLDSWETQDGQKRTKLKVTGETVQFLSSGEPKGKNGASAPSGAGRPPASAPPAGNAGRPPQHGVTRGGQTPPPQDDFLDPDVPF